MQRGNTVFYTKHIYSNIQKLDERKDKWNYHHINFLEQYCEPVKRKINFFRAQIERYKIMRDTQEQTIQQEPEIARIFAQVKQYRHTKSYFNQKLDEYEKKSLELKQYNNELKRQILFIRKGIKVNQQQLGFQLPVLDRSIVKINSQEQSDTRSIKSKSFVLPSLSQKYQTQSSMPSSKVAIEKKRIVNIGQKIQKFRSLRLPTHQKPLNGQQTVIKQDLIVQNQEEHNEKKARLKKIRERMTQFNKTQTLFNDCFQVKKNSVQRSVSQLQSKLIGNRQQFLNTCHAIGSKQEKVDFDVFAKLSSDEILTLFISFVWLNKKMTSEFAAKRKMIMDFIGKLPKLDRDF